MNLIFFANIEGGLYEVSGRLRLLEGGAGLAGKCITIYQ